MRVIACTIPRRKVPSSLLFAALLWTSCGNAYSASIYQVESVEVSLPLPQPAGKNLQAEGMVQAERIALQRLIHRMVSQKNQNDNKDFLRDLRQEPKSLIERTLVRSEKQLANSLVMTVDVAFGQSAVKGAFERGGLPYSEAPYPPTLVVEDEKSLQKDAALAFQKALVTAASVYGIHLARPLGDMNDLAKLSWDQVVAGSPELYGWVAERYGVQRIWAIQVDLTGTDSDSWEPPRFVATASFLEQPDAKSYNRPNHLRLEQIFADDQDAQTCLFPQMATEFLRQIINRWIDAHVVEPSPKHLTKIRIIHGFNLDSYAKFVKKLTAIPGCSGYRFVRFQAQDASVEIDCQGTGEKLAEAITGLGVNVSWEAESMVVRVP